MRPYQRDRGRQISDTGQGYINQSLIFRTQQSIREYFLVSPTFCYLSQRYLFPHLETV